MEEEIELNLFLGKRHDSNHLFQGTSIQQKLFIPNFVQSLFAQFSFLLLAILLPRSLEYQCRLMHQWKMKSQSTLEKLSLTSSALARLLVSIVPRFVIAKISCPERAIEIYSKSHQNIGLVLINFIVIPSKPLVTQQQKQTSDSSYNSTASATMNNSESKSKTQVNNEEPTEIADRVRLLNRVIHLVDSLALGQQKQTGATLDVPGENTMNERESDNIYAGGTMVGYATGLGTHEESDCQNHHSLKASQTTVNQWSCLIKFIERVIVICDQINQKTKSSSPSSSSCSRQIYVQAALHSGSCIFGFVSSQHPVFTLWGEPLETCRQLLSKHQLNHLGSQHFILATDKLISLIPSNLLDASSTANLHLNANQKTTVENSNLLNQYLFTWCTIDPSNGKIILSTQLQRSAPLVKMPNGRPPFIDRLLHFCTVRSNVTMNTTTAPATETATNTSISSKLPYVESTSESNKQVCSLFNTYDQPVSMISNNAVTNGLILSQASAGVSSQKQNHACDPIKFNQLPTDHHSHHNISRLPTNNNSNDNNILRTTISIVPDQIALNSGNTVPFNPIQDDLPKVLIPTTATIGVQQRLANVIEQTNHRRKSQLIAGANVVVNTPTSQFSNSISSPPPPPPPHQRTYPSNNSNNNMSTELSTHLNTPTSCIMTQSTTVTGTVNMQHINNNERKHNPAPYLLKNSQQKCGIPPSNITYKPCEINREDHKLQTLSPQLEHLSKKNQIHSTTISTTNNNNNNLNAPNPSLLKPVRPSSYWPVPDELLLSSDQIQTNHQNINNSCNNKESMAESQSNLSDVVNNSGIIKNANRNSRPGLFATSSQIDPRDRFVYQTPITQQQSLDTNQTKGNPNSDMDISKKLIKDSRLFSVIDPSSTNIIHNFVETNGQLINTNGIHLHSDSHPMQKNILDFPDYQRPSSPGYTHEKQQSTYPTEIGKSDHSVKQHQIISTRNVNHYHSSSPVSGSSSTGHSLASGSRKSDQHHSYCNNGMMMIVKTNVNDSKQSSNSSRSNSQGLQSQSNRLTMIETTSRCVDHIIIPNISDTRRVQINNQCLIDEVSSL
ncbi:hypothetical protein Smp_140060 [Schistosoma mansoni]|uniref:hypothetical protein n=1 Tax=Schistosoma mansoni TaxID=6183 RepID=UPI00022DBFCE|nr:hypothetical protein Smp_140060 [Schistosoma mansoni]|eukprot:XP_018653620.1 hypothetical protein Smp_140060 [Schistosoma mansoni]